MMITNLVNPTSKTSVATIGQQGFTMVAVAAMVMIIGIAVAALLPDTFTSQRDKILETQRRMKIVRDSVYQYYTDNARLPCPTEDNDGNPGTTADNFALAQAITSAQPPIQGVTCNTASAGAVFIGGVPTKTLSLSDEMGFDAWGTKFRYVVERAYADASAVTPTHPSTTIIVQGNGGRPRYSDGKLFYNGGVIHGGRTQFPIGLLISSGADMEGGFVASGSKNPDAASVSLQFENQDDDSVFFVDRFYPEQPDGKNDDLVEGIFYTRSCEEPVLCACQTGTTCFPATPASPAQNTPTGCVFGVGNVASFATGDNAHGIQRVATCRGGGTRTVVCNNGAWELLVPASGVCP